jgi:hypothetical protein
MLSTDQLKSTSNLQKLTHFWQEQADGNLKQIFSMRNCSLSTGDIELVRQTKTSLRTHPIMVEIIQKGNKCDVVLEIWCIQVIHKNYGENELMKYQNNTGRFRLNKNAFWWIGRILPCWSENISNLKKGDNQKIFDAKVRICDRNGREMPKLGIYECSVDQCPDCKDRGRKCTPSSKGLHPSTSTNTDLSDYFRSYSNNSNGEINYMRVGELKGETGHYRVEVVYFNDKVHNEMIAAANTKVSFMNSPRSNNIGIINDYSPDMINRPRATITHSPPSTRTSPLPVSNNNLKPMIYSDHGKSAPVNINEQGSSQNSLSKEANSQQKYSFSFDKDIIELLATSPQSSLSQQDNTTPLWKKLERNDDEAPVSPRKFEKRRSGRRKSSSGKSSVMSSGDESQFAFDSETPKKSEERPILFEHDPDFYNF